MQGITVTTLIKNNHFINLTPEINTDDIILTDAAVMQRACGVFHTEAEVFGIEERGADHVDAAGIFLFQLPGAGQELVFIRGVEGVHEVEVAFDEFQEGGLLVDDEGDGYGIEVGEGAAEAVAFEIKRVAAHDQLDVLFPQLHEEGACAAGVLAEVLAIMFHHFARHHGAVGHAEEAEEGAERLFETYDEGGVVGGFEMVYLVENPPSGRCHVRVEDAVEAVEKVGGRDRAGGVGGGKELVLMEIDIIT